MLKTCQKCGHANPSATGDAMAACPACGAIYSKVAEAMAAKAQPAPAPTEQHAAASAASAHSGMKRADQKYCTECGSIINAKAEICPKCGVRQLPAPTAGPLGRSTTDGKNKVVAGLLALFLGGIGVHKFYLGKGVQGLLYLVFFWTFIPAILGFVEGLNYLLMSEQTFFERYGS